MAARLTTFKAVSIQAVRQNPETLRDRERPEVSYVSLVYQPELFRLPTWGINYF